MFLSIHPENPEPRKIAQAVEILKQGGVIIYPTDAVYVIGCSLFDHKAVQKVAQLKGIKPEKANFTLMCEDLSHISEYTKPISTATFRVMKDKLPGPFTFILEANNEVPRIFRSKKKTVGIRVPDNKITQTLIRELGNPLISTSVHNEDEILEYISDPSLIADDWEDRVDLIIDGGMSGLEATTIIDCSGAEPEVIREGKGSID
ncbi:L-threonylcarbamoyladenylate synthase [Luteibaculum oceani]|uniref:Threonylcarbamoyl-AMP synthase n=1 Tax=Luteibaculum oceani TaxID=1294296 RepID=A0A5C6V9B3_9FLAO|nr:L-threonylcarbamoyladenylate synthase [Luteibaculum oceani]TXC82052.1 threonylcarbamoyl-AMP synthase [Luteibaculum oceani]